ncbi:MAG: PPC domain-containing protein, partial [Planctomycetota bacterium]
MSFDSSFLFRTLAVASCLGLAIPSMGWAQCPADDATTTNIDCASAAPGSVGTVSGLSVQDLNEDWWSYDVLAGDSLTLDVNLLSGNADLDLALFDDAGTCVNLVDNSETTGSAESVTYDNVTAGTVTVTLRVFLFSGICEDYDLTATTAIAPPPACSMIPDDLDEENDDCLSAVVPSADPLTGLFVSKMDEDWYSYTVADGDILTLDVTHVHAEGDIDLELYLDDCTTVLELSDTSTDNENLSWTNNTGAVATVFARVFIWPFDVLDCNANYGLSSSTAAELCLTSLDDAFEENDDCTMATPLTPGVQTGLFCRKQGVDEDWYSIEVLDGDTLNLTVSFVSDDGDIDLTLFETCGGVLLDSGTTATDNESVSWTNTTGATMSVFWSVFVWAGDPTEECNVYDMDVDVPPLPIPNLIPFCFGDGS